MCIKNGCDAKRGDLAIEQNIFSQQKNEVIVTRLFAHFDNNNRNPIARFLQN